MSTSGGVGGRGPRGPLLPDFILQAMAEEKQLAVKFGERYRNYCRRVPRFNLPLGMVRYVRRRLR